MKADPCPKCHNTFPYLLDGNIYKYHCGAVAHGYSLEQGTICRAERAEDEQCGRERSVEVHLGSSIVVYCAKCGNIYEPVPS